MNMYPSNKKVNDYFINVQYEGGNFTKIQDDESITCCGCIPAITGMKILTVLTGLSAFGTFGISLVSFVLMVMWWADDNKKTRNYLYIANLLQCIVLIIVMILSAIAIAGAGAAVAMSPEAQQVMEESGASGGAALGAIIGSIIVPFSIGLCIQVHYVQVAKRLRDNIQE